MKKTIVLFLLLSPLGYSGPSDSIEVVRPGMSPTQTTQPLRPQPKTRRAPVRRRVAKPLPAAPKAVDLSKLDAAPVAVVPQSSSPVAPSSNPPESTTPSAMSQASGPSHQGIHAWKAYFDFWLINRPGVQDLTFANIHSFLFLDLVPSSKYRLAFDVSSAWGSPLFFQFDMELNPRFTLSVGKIFIPFDDLDPHNLFGGRTNVSDPAFIQPGQTAFFLPNLWTDLGVAGKYVLVDKQNFRLVSTLYTVNGFGDGGRDPRQVDSSYPSFRDTSVLARDNNRDKAIGGRLSTTIGGRFSLGGSYYQGRWNAQNETKSKMLRIIGVDSQIRLRMADIRIGAVHMTTDLQNTTFKRGGYYGEIGIPFAEKWRFVARQGSVQLDNRVESITDMSLVGGRIVYRPDFVQWSIEWNRDIQDRPGKVGRTFAAARMLIEL